MANPSVRFALAKIANKKSDVYKERLGIKPGDKEGVAYDADLFDSILTSGKNFTPQ